MPGEQRAGSDVTERARADEKIRDLEVQVAELQRALSESERESDAQTQAEASLRVSEQRLRDQYQGSPVPTYSWHRVDDDFVLEDFNVAAEAITGGTVGAFLGRSASDMYAHDPQVLAEFGRCASEQRTLHREMTYRFSSTGRMVDLAVTYVFVPPDRVMVHTEDITERTRAEADLRHQAMHDSLTGLPNRALLNDRLQQAVTIQGQIDGARVALLLLDLDRFKDVNDTLGHQVGDVLLQQIGQRLQGAVQAADLVARLGGDEFAIVLPGIDAEGAAEVAEVLVRVLQAPFVLEGQAIAIGASIGIAVAPEHGHGADTLLRCADVAMYQAKRSGSAVSLYCAAEDRHRPDRLALLGELRTAIENDELLLHYQPKLDMRTGTLVGVEALVRWQHPQRGFLPPGEFIPLAELSGLINPLSYWVLETALRQQNAWRATGMHIQVAVNLSRLTLHDPQLLDTVTQSLARWQLPPGALVLEITESGLMADPLRAAENLNQLRARGVHISIDDFGTGYSSLASLKNLSVDELKIDQSFVQAMATDASSRAIVRAIVDLADALKLQVVAEGVEDRATWDVLAELGCQMAQGYFLSRPLDAADLEVWRAQMGSSWVEIAARATAEDPLQERNRGRRERLTAEEEFIARTQAEAALLASEERTRLALQAAGMGTWDFDIVHNVHTWSAETQALHGLRPGEFDRTSDALQRQIDPRDWPAFVQEMQVSELERRNSFISYRTVWPNGDVHWLENKGRATYASDGSLLRVSGTSTDITERKLAEEALRAAETRFRKQYKGMPLPTYSWCQQDDDFVLEDYNDAAEAIVGVGIRDWLGGLASARYADEPGILDALRACLAEQHTLRRDVAYQFPETGLVRDLAITYVFVPPQTVMMHTEDVTDATQAEKQRVATAQSEKLRALGQMATGIAHDLNQSLMLVSSYSDLARQALSQDPPNLIEAEELLTTTTQAALDGGESVKRLLRFTRASSDDDRQLVSLSGVAHEAAQWTGPRWRDAAQAEGRPISLHVEADSHPTVHGSPAQLRDLMTNLIFNAVDALPNGGTIGVRVVTEKGQAIIEVADSGVGMTAEVQERVFEPFFTTKGERGTGLGLAMVFGIVEKHGGRIEVRSAPGDGTTMRISLPLAQADADAEHSPQGAQHVKVVCSLRVLVVDDEPMMTRAMARMLKPAGHEVSVAVSGEEALAMLSAQPFDVVISDMGMGAGMNGWELADALKRRWPDLRVLLATGWGAAIDPGEALARGIEAVLAKPYHPVDLVRALERLAPAA